MTLILFDFDGVLADTLDDLLQFSQEICNELGVHHQVVKEDISILEAMSFANIGRQMEVPEPLIDEFVRRSLAKVANKKSPPCIFKGLAEVVRDLIAKCEGLSHRARAGGLHPRDLRRRSAGNQGRENLTGAESICSAG